MARILHVVGSPRAEGTPRLVLDWLSVPGHQQVVAFLDSEPPDLLPRFRQSGTMIEIGAAIVAGPRKFFEIARASRLWVDRHKPDVVIAWTLGFSHWVFLGARLAGSQACLLSHGGNPPGKGWRERYLMTWICLWTTFACGGRMVACSRYVQRLFRGIPGVPPSAVGFAYNCVQAAEVAERADRARSARSPNSVPVAVMVATLERHKDHRTLLGAAALLRQRSVLLRITIVGGGREEPYLKELASELALGEFVCFLGVRADVPEILGQSDLFVLSTTAQEGRPGVILEALAAGLPIVASDVEPLREVLEDGAWGRLVPAADPVKMAEALEAECRDPAVSRSKVLAGREHARQFTPERMIHDYLAEAGITTVGAERSGTAAADLSSPGFSRI